VGGLQPIEASGAVYVQRLKKYLVISDDTEKKAPLVHVMTPAGVVDGVLRIGGLSAVDDMEGVAQDYRGMFYFVSSQSRRAGGGVPAERRLLARARWDDGGLEVDGRVDLLDLLDRAASKRRDTEWGKFVRGAIDDSTIDIEGVFCDELNLYLGFKAPLRGNRAVILTIRAIDRVFDWGRLDENDVGIWQTLDLGDRQTGLAGGISDMHYHEGKVYILSYAERAGDTGQDHAGNLWVYDIERERLGFVMRFAGEKPEGIAYNDDTGEFLVTFDHGDDGSAMMVLRGVR
jgi:hypothetical protein